MDTPQLLQKYRQTVLDQIETLGAVRLKGLDWNSLRESSLDTIILSVYVQGAEDALRHLQHLLDTPPESGVQA